MFKGFILKTLTEIILQGFAIGNGLTNPAIQYGAYADYALDMGIIKQSDHDRINAMLPLCESSIKLCGNNTDHVTDCSLASNEHTKIQFECDESNFYSVNGHACNSI